MTSNIAIACLMQWGSVSFLRLFYVAYNCGQISASLGFSVMLLEAFKNNGSWDTKEKCIAFLLE